jgi:hypothetical protein
VIVTKVAKYGRKIATRALKGATKKPAKARTASVQNVARRRRA